MYPKQAWRKVVEDGSMPRYLQRFHSLQSPTYEKLTQDGLEETPPLENQKPTRRWLVYSIASAIIFICLALLAATSLMASWGSNTHTLIIKSCGESPEEATSRGCIFEPMMSSWMHPLCYFQEVADLYVDKFEQWRWFRDPDLNEPITDKGELDRMRAGNYTVAFTDAVGSHVVHCLYSWRKLSFAMEHHRKWLDARTLAYGHTTHCAAAVMETVTSSDFVPLLREQYFEEVPEWKQRNPNSSVWPLLFHSCIPLQGNLEKD